MKDSQRKRGNNMSQGPREALPGGSADAYTESSKLSGWTRQSGCVWRAPSIGADSPYWVWRCGSSELRVGRVGGGERTAGSWWPWSVWTLFCRQQAATKRCEVGNPCLGSRRARAQYGLHKWLLNTCNAPVGWRNWFFFFISINLNLKTDTPFSYWKIFKYVWNIWVCESAFSTINLVKSKYRSKISDANVVSKLSCTIHVK